MGKCKGLFPIHQNIKKGVDVLRAADTVLFWSEYHDDWSNERDRMQIIKRIHRLGCQHEVIKVLCFRMRPIEQAGPKPAKVWQLGCVQQQSDNEVAQEDDEDTSGKAK